MLQCHVDCFLVLYSCLGPRWQWSMSLAVAERLGSWGCYVDVFRLPIHPKVNSFGALWKGCVWPGCTDPGLHCLPLANHLHKAEAEVTSPHALHVHGGSRHGWGKCPRPVARRCPALSHGILSWAYMRCLRSQLIEGFQIERGLNLYISVSFLKISPLESKIHFL